MKKILLGLAAGGTALAMLPLFAAFEAHVINVTATIENALSVPVTPISYGTVFPQEKLDQPVTVGLSQSFSAQQRVNHVDYVIRQKPKCGVPIPNTNPVQYSQYVQVTEDAQGNYVCPLVNVGTTEPIMVPSVELPLLCPYLSKNSDNTGDTGIKPFHGPITGWKLADTIATQVLGHLNTWDNPTTWTIDFKVPCFAGQCAQDWAKFVTDNGPTGVDPNAYIQPANMEHSLFGCDLWIETTGISRVPL